MNPMTKVVYQPCTDSVSQKNLKKTIYNAVDLDEIRKFISKPEMEHLERIYPGGKAQLWGVVPSRNTNRSIKELSPGDVAIFNVQSTFKIIGVVTHKTNSKALAEKLWGLKSSEPNQTWESIYFLHQVAPIASRYEDVIKGTAATQNRFFFLFDHNDSSIILENLQLANVSVTDSKPPKQDEVDKEIDAEVDGKTETRTRKEHSAIVNHVFGRKETRDCVICGSVYPRSYLRAAHIRKRSSCTVAQKKDVRNIATSMCVFGCDSLFENGLISVSGQGKVMGHPTRVPEGPIRRYISEFTGRTCSAYSTKNADYFRWHREEYGFG
jgi:hypothetical protein